MLKERGSYVPILDSLRAFAALSVCLYHFVTGTVNFIHNKAILDFFHLGHNGVHLFFVISGFIIPWSLYRSDYEIKKYVKFIVKRLLRLEPPYIISIILVLLVTLSRIYFLNSNDQISFKNIALHFGYLIPFFEDQKWLRLVYWTLAIEFQFYLFMGLFYFILKDKRIIVRLIAYFSVLVLSFIGDHKFLFHWLPVFLIGNLLFLKLTNKIHKFEFLSATMITLIFIYWALPPMVSVTCFLSVLAILFFFDFSIPVLSRIGKFSYSLYLVHTIIGTTLINFFCQRYFSYSSKIIIVLLGLGVSLLASYLMFLWVEKPSQRLSSKLKFD